MATRTQKKKSEKKLKKTAKKTKKNEVKRKDTVERIFNVRPSPDQEKDWLVEDLMPGFAPSEGDSGVLRDGAPAGAGLPNSVDLVAGCDNWWTIGDQGSTGSCVGWATADSVLRWHMVKQKLITSKLRDRPSVRYVWMGAKETDIWTNRPATFIEESGTSLKAALDLARKFGVCRESALPFRINTDYLVLGDESSFWSETAKLRVLVYFNLGSGFLDKLIKWRKWLALQGPILTRLDVDNEFRYCTGTLKKYKKPPTPRGHAVAIVGYTPSTFKVRNSWGKSWGKGGYASASHAYTFAAFTEAYGVTTFGVP